MLLVSYTVLNQSITVENVWLLTYKDTSGVAKKAADIAHKRE